MAVMDRRRSTSSGYGRLRKSTILLVRKLSLTWCTACCEPRSGEKNSIEQTPRCPGPDSTATFNVASTALRFSPAPSTDRHILCQIPGMVVFSRIARSFSVDISAGPCRPPAPHAPTSPSWHPLRQAELRQVSDMSQ